MSKKSTADLIQRLKNYQPYDAQESQDLNSFFSFLETQNEVWTRKNIHGHLTASAWIINPCKSKVLMVYHNIYDSWSWTGGHADGETDLLKLAIREAQEETGIEKVKAYSEDFFSVELLTVDGHVKKNHFVSAHLHYNITFLLEADDQQKLVHNPQENSSVKWFSLDEAIKASSEPYMKKIYSKLNAKLISSC